MKCPVCNKEKPRLYLDNETRHLYCKHCAKKLKIDVKRLSIFC